MQKIIYKVKNPDGRSGSQPHPNPMPPEIIKPPVIDMPPEIKKVPKYFSMDVELDNEKYVRDVKKYIDEVAGLIMNLPNAKTSIRLVVEISVPDGILDSTKDIVTDNCKSLKIGTENFKFK